MTDCRFARCFIAKRDVTKQQIRTVLWLFYSFYLSKSQAIIYDSF